MLHRVINEEPDLGRVPAAQRDLIARCLAKRPSARPTPDRILDELADLVAAGHEAWAAVPHATMIADYVTEASLYAQPEPEPEPVPEPEPEPEVEVEPAPASAARPSRVAGTSPGLDPSPDRRSGRSAWVSVLTAAVVFAAGTMIVLNLRDSGKGGFRPWSIDDVRGAPVVADGLVYVGKPDGTAAHDARTGRQRWASRRRPAHGSGAGRWRRTPAEAM